MADDTADFAAGFFMDDEDDNAGDAAGATAPFGLGGIGNLGGGGGGGGGVGGLGGVGGAGGLGGGAGGAGGHGSTFVFDAGADDDFHDGFLTQYADDDSVNQQQILQNTLLQVERVPLNGWEAMPRNVNYLQRVIFSTDQYSPVDGTVESAAVLVEAFTDCVDQAASSGDRPALSHTEVLDRISATSRLTVLEVVRVQNMTRSMLSNAFAKTYLLQDDPPKTMFHGTDAESARLISFRGFRGACSNRSKFGKGIYISNVVWQAMAYSSPDPRDDSQTFLVVKFLQGPTALGTEGLIDFGTNAAGAQILTTTDASNTIFCASFGDQLLATYRIRVRFDTSARFTESQTALVAFFHPQIWQKHMQHVRADALANYSHGSSSNPQRPPPVQGAPTVYIQVDTHAGISVGERVVVQNSWFAHKFCDGKEGFVRAIVKDNKVMFCVEIVDVPGIDARIEAANVKGRKPVYPGVNMGYVRCITNQIMKAQIPVMAPLIAIP